MLKNLSIRGRFTLMTAFLLTICCIGLTLILNVSAFQLVDQIDAFEITSPAMDITSLQGGAEVDSAMPPMKLQEVQGAKKSYGLQSFLYMLGIIVGGSAVTYYLSSKALKPLKVLNNQVKQVNVQTLAQSIPISSTKDEISELTQSFNDMTDKLNESFLMQKRFSANAAHELRTPLTILQTKLDVFRKKSTHNGKEYETMIEVFEKQTLRLRMLVDNLLSLTNQDQNQEVSSVHLKDLFEDILVELSTIAKQKEVTMFLKCDEATLLGNIELLYQAFYNLVENAIKYNVIGGKVEIVVETRQNGQVDIKVLDTGIGIPEEVRKHIFEPFYRVDPSRSRKIAGVGLGLSIVDHIVKRHNGSIQVFDGEQGGTCFQILFKS